jgi:hypothetical protein
MRKKVLAVLFTCMLAIGWPLQAQTSESFSVASIGLASAASATDLFTITGSSSKIVYITKVVVTCTQTTAGTINVVLLTRSTADSGGTSSNPTAVALDPNNQGNNSATINAYTGNPTTGTLVGNLGSYDLNCPTTSGSSANDIVLETFGITADPLVLRGTGSVFAVNLNGVTVTGGAFDIRVEWREN